MLCPARLLSVGEKERLTRRYVSEIMPILGPDQDIPAPDAGTDAQVMAWILDTYSMMIGHQELGVADGQRQFVGDAILHGAGGEAGTFESSGLGLGGAPRVLSPQIDGDVDHDCPAGDKDDRQREASAQLLGHARAGLQCADQSYACDQCEPDQALDAPQNVGCGRKLGLAHCRPTHDCRRCQNSVHLPLSVGTRPSIERNAAAPFQG